MNIIITEATPAQSAEIAKMVRELLYEIMSAAGVNALNFSVEEARTF